MACHGNDVRGMAHKREVIGNSLGAATLLPAGSTASGQKENAKSSGVEAADDNDGKVDIVFRY